ncbi:hypothetical protein I8748_24280 [Nostoc sp. CENA67]|uniref:Uncharacterized protein n=1 Tax=Amazonocrinis nigriterrae CENA67 TaxID=2794033 RepID=A0A8J7LBE7_9NOST|nr:hypothetical protein [Amazonocrinis nigriterrae]MBH8565261.1 hypothetical protein [Amazonocrinis nigriterrae CENA67]
MLSVDLKTAVNAAREYILNLQEIMGNSVENLRLEEVELSEDKKFWLITLGFDIPIINPKNRMNDIFSTFPTENYQREYKLFKVNSQTGEVEAMKIREV